MAGHRSHFYCTVCDGYGTDNTYNTEIEQWRTRSVSETRRLAEAWRDADTLKDRNKIFAEHGVRWSELWRLPYWDPTRMLVIDSMHCILEGLVHYHCRRVLCIDAEVAGAPNPQQPSYSYPWISYNSNTFPGLSNLTDTEVQQVDQIHQLLMLPINSGNDTLTDSQLLNRLSNKNLKPLKYVSSTLSLPNSIMTAGGILAPVKTKNHFSTLLVNWRLRMPLSSPGNMEKPITMKTLQYIQHVIKTATRPSWIHSIPAYYGESSAGTIKADEWRILSTIYLPIALITLWGDNDGSSPPDSSHLLRLLDHTMALFQAVTLVVRYTMTPLRAANYRKLIKEWVDGLYSLHPHTIKHRKRPNVHAAFHLYDFLLLFGPVISWWCFPFERLIGVLQKINTNDIIGGPLEQTILRSLMRAANLRRWLRRSDCPEIIRQFKNLFDKAFSSVSPEETTPNIPLPHVSREVAHYTHNGYNYSRASTHLGNSLVLYYPMASSVMPVAGSIEKMTVSAKGVQLLIRRQAPLPAGQYDPFRRYPLFPAVTYSSTMIDGPTDKVTFEAIVSHVVRFNFSFNRAVVLNLSRVSMTG
ncbi:hypothetical protein BDZ94DRAFT_1327639 [Collybia nuda]|uniref:Uncharacterized protein n=1 Tax=Collybia nuda TaxID=64659 RepID=A0A9P6C7X5_9AGAR|nr:hypothetical protein BDZ94DRAFT_1327639 [Collybia nuda]